MTQTTHTPGPWVATRDGIGAWSVRPSINGIDSPQALATMPTCGKLAREEAAFNARLIAAAPELLIALQDLTMFAMQERGAIHDAALRARAAIARATGGAA